MLACTTLSGVSSRREYLSGRLLSPAVILALGWLVQCVYAWPGHGTFDSSWQLAEARAHHYTSWHPPAMAVLWHYIEYVAAGPVGMMVLQITCFLAGAYLLLRCYLPPRLAALIAGLILWFPPIGSTMAVIWKDSMMTGFALVGTAWLVSERRWVSLAGLAMLGLATLMRHNAFTVTFAIIMVGFAWSPAWRGWRRYAVAVAAWLAITVAAQLVNAALTDEAMYPWHGSVALADITGTLRWAPPLSDAELAPALDGVPLVATRDLQARATAVYSPIHGVFKVLDDGFLQQPATADQRAAVERAWRTLVLDHPRAYLWHRLLVFRQVLMLSDRPTELVVMSFGGQAVTHLTVPVLSTLQRAERWIVRRCQPTVLFRPYIYLLALLVLAPLWIRERRILAVAASGLISELGLLVAAPTPDFRYSLWLVVATALVIAMVIGRRARHARIAGSGPRKAPTARRGRSAPSEPPRRGLR